MGNGMSFTPPLNGALTLALPPTLPDDAPVDLTFTARFDSKEAATLARRERARLELWSDLPADGRPAGTWGALPFGWASDTPAAAAAAPPTGLATLELAPVPDPASDTAPAEDDAERLVLRFAARFPTPAWGGPLRFAYTYRLVYPDGGVRWLGAFGRDGALRVERCDARVALATPQGHAWARAPGGGEYRWETARRADVEVARLDPALGWAVWAVDQDGHTTFYPTLAALPAAFTPALLVLLPQTPRDAPLVLQPLVLRTRALAALSIAPATGALTIAYAGTPPPALLALRSYDASWDLRAFAEDVFRDTRARLVGAVPQSGCAVLAGPAGAAPVALSVVPLALGAPAPPAALLSSRDLAALLPPAPALALFAPACGDALRLAAPQEKDAPLFVRGGPRGGQALLAAAHALGDGGASVAVLTPHEAAAELEPEPVPEPVPEPKPEAVVEPEPTPELVPEVVSAPQETAEEIPKEEPAPAQDAAASPAAPPPTTPPAAPAAIPEPTTTDDASSPPPAADTAKPPSSPKRGARTAHLPSPPPTPGRLRSPAQSISGAPAGYFAGFGAAADAERVSGALRRRGHARAASALGLGAEGAPEDVPEDQAPEEEEEAATPAPAEEDSPAVAPRARSATPPPPAAARAQALSHVQTAGMLLRTHGARACVRLYVSHLLRLSALLVAFVLARALAAIGIRRAAVPPPAPAPVAPAVAVVSDRGRSRSPAARPEQEVMVISDEEEGGEAPAPAPAEPATPAEETTPTPAEERAPLPAEEPAPAPAEDAHDDAASTASSTVAGSPKLGPDGAAAAQLAPVAPELDLPPAYSPAPAPELAPSPKPEAAAKPAALRFAVPAGEVALLVSGAPADALRLALGGAAVVPAAGAALGDGVLLRLRAEAAGVLSVAVA